MVTITSSRSDSALRRLHKSAPGVPLGAVPHGDYQLDHRPRGGCAAKFRAGAHLDTAGRTPVAK